jgi:hypothetical protein
MTYYERPKNKGQAAYLLKDQHGASFNGTREEPHHIRTEEAMHATSFVLSGKSQ